MFTILDGLAMAVGKRHNTNKGHSKLETEADTKPRKNGKHWPRLLVIILFLILTAVTGVLYYKYRQAVDALSQPQKLADHIGKTIALPSETPSLLTISDKTKLSDESLTKIVNDGDRLLVYAKARKVIVYRPSSQKVVDILSIQPPTQHAETADKP